MRCGGYVWNDLFLLCCEQIKGIIFAIEQARVMRCGGFADECSHRYFFDVAQTRVVAVQLDFLCAIYGDPPTGVWCKISAFLTSQVLSLTIDNQNAIGPNKTVSASEFFGVLGLILNRGTAMLYRLDTGIEISEKLFSFCKNRPIP